MHSYEFISIDDLKMQKLGMVDDHSIDKEIWYEARAKMKSVLESGNSVVFDSTFSTLGRRDHFMGIARAVPVTIIEGLFFDIPLEEVLKRNRMRGTSGGKLADEAYIREAYEKLRIEPPTPNEDFDVLIRIDEYGKISEVKGHADNVLLKYLREHPTDNELQEGF